MRIIKDFLDWLTGANTRKRISALETKVSALAKMVSALADEVGDLKPLIGTNKSALKGFEAFLMGLNRRLKGTGNRIQKIEDLISEAGIPTTEGVEDIVRDILHDDLPNIFRDDLVNSVRATVRDVLNNANLKFELRPVPKR